MVLRMPLFAAKQPGAFAAPMVGCVVRDGISQITGQHTQRDSACAPQATQQQHRHENQQSQQACTEDGGRADQCSGPQVVLCMPTFKRLQAMQYKAVQGVFNDRPAGQACQRQAGHFQPLRARATNE